MTIDYMEHMNKKIVAEMKLKYGAWEEMMRLVIKPKPKYFPKWLWWRLLNLVYVQEVRK